MINWKKINKRLLLVLYTFFQINFPSLSTLKIVKLLDQIAKCVSGMEPGSKFEEDEYFKSLKRSSDKNDRRFFLNLTSSFQDIEK